MSEIKNVFIESIHKRVIVKITFNAKDKGIITRRCIPFDFGPSRRYKDGLDRYHFYDLDSPEGNHNLSILPEQLITIVLVNEGFRPDDYVKWTPKWFIKRDWGNVS